jgi:AcrR family transcriptional regulator
VPRAKQRTPELRDRLLQVAVATLARDGVAAFTTRRVAEEADTSTPAVYELFGDKAGLVREVFFEGFRALRSRLAEGERAAHPVDELVRVIQAFRILVRENPVLAEVMFSRPFADFDPTQADLRAGQAVREYVVGRVTEALAAGAIAGDATDIAHVLVATAQGLAAQETAGWLGTTRASRDRRWDLAIGSVLAGLASPPGGLMATQPA